MPYRNLWKWVGTGLLLLIVPVLVRDPYYLHLINMSGLSILLAASLNLITGFLGELNLGHAAFYGVGAYASALLTMRLHLPFLLTLPVASLLAAFSGALIAYPCLRLKGPYFAIATFGYGEIVRLILHNWDTLTNGPLGLRGIPGPAGFINSKVEYYYFILTIVALSLLAIWRLLHSQLGRTFWAVRQDSVVLAEMIGINSTRVKVLAFMVAAYFAGVAGSLYAHYLRFISPDTFSFLESSTALAMVIVGGLGTFWGPVLGAILFTWLPELLRSVSEYRMIFYGLLLWGSITFLPQGISGFLESRIRKNCTTGVARDAHS
ncbi:MAG: branched-chain amino acid ABC transporter permease [Firmicutes bacterium]|nr:branched-chain amino acid ABC transporter permease [Bacillota bacterium]